MKAPVKTIRKIVRTFLIVVWKIQRNLEWISIRASFGSSLDRDRNTLDVQVEYGFTKDDKQVMHFGLPLDVKNHANHEAMHEVQSMMLEAYAAALVGAKTRRVYVDVTRGPKK